VNYTDYRYRREMKEASVRDSAGELHASSQRTVPTEFHTLIHPLIAVCAYNVSSISNSDVLY
jgi:hypothetical protein